MIANSPHFYRDINLAVLEKDWTRFFSDAELPPNRLEDVYYEVIKHKAETNNTFGIITNVDMLNGWLRIKARNQGMSEEICKLCGKKLSEKGGLYKEYSPRLSKDTLLKCNQNHIN